MDSRLRCLFDGGACAFPVTDDLRETSTVALNLSKLGELLRTRATVARNAGDQAQAFADVADAVISGRCSLATRGRFSWQPWRTTRSTIH